MCALEHRGDRFDVLLVSSGAEAVLQQLEATEGGVGGKMDLTGKLEPQSDST